MKNRLLSVEASAGSGKTFRLANRYIALLQLAKPQNILAITYTNKASNEMRSRILKFLQELGKDKAVVQMVADELGMAPDAVLQKKEELLEKFLLGDIHIQTIDSFVNVILRKFSLFGGVRSDFEIKEIDGAEVFESFLENLDEQAFEKLLEFAKSEERFIALRALFEELYEKDKELGGVRFARYPKPSDAKAKKAFERFREYILQSSEASPKAKNGVNIDFYDIPTKTWFQKERMDEYPYFKKAKLYQDWFEDVLKELHDFFKDYFLYKESLFFQELFLYYERYKEQRQKLLQAHNALSFKDIEHAVFDLLQNGLRSDFLYFRLDSKIDHILIDEFQDTSITQWKIVEPLIDEIASGSGRSDIRSFFYVGDTKQAIYRFRGGAQELFYAVQKKYKNFGLLVETLDTNYRSAQNIVEFVNEKFGLQEKAKREEKGYVEVCEVDKERMLEAIYEKICFLNENGVRDEDIAVLVHTGDEIVEIGAYLNKQGKRVVSSTNVKVIHQPSAKAIIALMNYLNDPKQKIELLNFYSLIGKHWSPQAPNIAIQRPFLMVKEIMDRFGLYDEASLKLLEFANGCDTLVDFCHNVASYDAKIPPSMQKGIHLITIHKSKGLEFGHVIVVDRLRGERRDGRNILFYYEDMELKDMKLKIKGREAVDSFYKKVLEKEQMLKRQDRLNVEYVAFTRAKNSLIILKKAGKTKQGKPLSAFVTPLEELQRGSVIPSKKELDEWQFERVKLTMRNFGKQTKEDMVEEIEYKPNDYEAIFLGDAIHYALECEDIEAVRNHFGAYCNIEDVEKYFTKAKKRMKKGFKEVPFIFDGKVGRIDRFVEEENEIIDYKLSSPKDKRQYFAQVRNYIKAVEAISGKKARGFLYYVDEEEFEEVK